MFFIHKQMLELKNYIFFLNSCVLATSHLINIIFINDADELDSYMYQTVGHQAIDLYAEAMDLPLYRRTIQGTSLETGRNYSETKGDEVEDLYELLRQVKVSFTPGYCGMLMPP